MKARLNFKCKGCGHKFYVNEFSTIYGAKIVFKDKNGLQLKCKCGCSDLESIKTGKVPTEVNLLGSVGGGFPSEKTLLKTKQKQRRVRSKHEFMNDTLPKMKPGWEKNHFKQKYKDVPMKDHEKMK